MKEQITLNGRLKDWIFSLIEDLIETAMEEYSEKVPTIIATNNFVKQLDSVSKEIEMTKIICEELTNEIFEEIKISI